MTNEIEIRSSGISAADLQMLKTFYRAFAGQPALLDDCVTTDWQDIPLAPGQATGRDGAKPLIEGFATVFAELRIEILEVIGGPNRAAVRAVMKGRHVGELFGVAPTQKEFALPIHEFHAFDNGRLTRTHHMEDWMSWFTQMGAAPNAA